MHPLTIKYLSLNAYKEHRIIWCNYFKCSLLSTQMNCFVIIITLLLSPSLKRTVRVHILARPTSLPLRLMPRPLPLPQIDETLISTHAHARAVRNGRQFDPRFGLGDRRRSTGRRVRMVPRLPWHFPQYLVRFFFFHVYCSSVIWVIELEFLSLLFWLMVLGLEIWQCSDWWRLWRCMWWCWNGRL